jgi:hypothetical protein
MGQARWEHTATLLSTEKVLIAGGSVPSVWLSSAELFDPSAASGSQLVDDCPTDPPTQSGAATLSPMASPTVAIPSALSTAAVTQRSGHPAGEPIRITGIPVLGSLSMHPQTRGVSSASRDAGVFA